ncbi:uncharacterized protein LOC131954434 [Physella acuta]|uniref:uncharacterized protein LOC131954434 n=1 Tax=Physella acuta TaxID=109671 RepID=UPI0027DD12FC|nr:uncharacterized protein LOC131954434 [Physella acuta]
MKKPNIEKKKEMARRRDSSSNVVKFMPPTLVNCSTSCSDLDLEENEHISISLATQTMSTNDCAVKQTSRSQKKEQHPAQHSLMDISQVVNDLEREVLKLKEMISACLKEEEAERRDCKFKKPKVSSVTISIDCFASTSVEDDITRLENEGVECCHGVDESHDDISSDQKKDRVRHRSKSEPLLTRNKSQHKANTYTSEDQPFEDLLCVSTNYSESEIKNRFNVRENNEKTVRQQSKSEPRQTRNTSQHKANTYTSEDQPFKDLFYDFTSSESEIENRFNVKDNKKKTIRYRSKSEPRQTRNTSQHKANTFTSKEDQPIIDLFCHDSYTPTSIESGQFIKCHPSSEQQACIKNQNLKTYKPKKNLRSWDLYY